MKLLFVDEFKPEMGRKHGKTVYGLSLISIDLKYYQKIKTGFEKSFKNLGWNQENELKGRYTYSKKIFDDISIEKRIKFAENLMSLSLSETGKTKRVTTYIALDVFDSNKNESEIYVDLLCRIFKKIPKPPSKQNGKNILACFLDNNDDVTRKISEIQLYKLLLDCLKTGWIILEKPIFVNSSNLHIGIIFSDFISYFFQNFIDTRHFFESTKSRLFQLLDNKKQNLQMQENEEKELDTYLINYKKKEQSIRIISILKDVEYV